MAITTVADASPNYSRNVEIAYPSEEAEYASLGAINHIACFSVTPSDEIRYDSSMLRYFVDPPSGADLRAGYYDCLQSNACNSTLGHPNRLDSLVEACLQLGAKQVLKKAHVVTSRGILKRYVSFKYIVNSCEMCDNTIYVGLCSKDRRWS